VLHFLMMAYNDGEMDDAGELVDSLLDLALVNDAPVAATFAFDAVYKTMFDAHGACPGGAGESVNKRFMTHIVPVPRIATSLEDCLRDSLVFDSGDGARLDCRCKPGGPKAPPSPLYRTTARKTIFLSSMKDAFVIRLNRSAATYAPSGAVVATTKLSTPVTFRATIDVSPYLEKKARSLEGGVTDYDLKAIVIHEGRLLSRGHYIAYVFDTIEGLNGGKPSWFEFDDTKVKAVSESLVLSLTTKVYMLLYRRAPRRAVARAGMAGKRLGAGAGAGDRSI